MSADLSPIYLCGPTASGKTAAAITLAQALDGEVVNADAYQIYRGIETISAAPSSEELAAAPHHLYSVLDVAETCDAMRYRELALPYISEIQSRGKLPIISGGSGLYLKFLTHGPSPVPSGDYDLRRKLEEKSLDELVAEFQKLDPAGAESTNLTNRRYVIRALEICLLSGEPMSEIKSDWEKHSTELSKGLRGIVLQWPREILYDRINQRTPALAGDRALDEVSAVRDRASATCEKAIGFRELCAVLDGTMIRDDAIAAIAQATRRYAKRQTSWFKREKWLHSLPSPATPDELLALAQQCLRSES